MGVASSPGPDRPRTARRTIRFTFATIVAVPVICLVLGWAAAVSFTPGGALVKHGLLGAGHRQLRDVAIYVGGGLVVVLAAVLAMGLFARRVSRDITGLERTARRLADELLAQVAGPGAQRLQAGAGQGPGTPRARTAEVERVTAAITGLRQAAAAVAADEASLRDGVAQVFVSLARRNQSLLQRQLRLIDALEQKAADPGALSDLFLLDHLTTRMRRHAENLIILSGEAPGRSWSEPVPVIDVIRGAVAEIEDYQRIRVVTRSQDAVTGSAVADMIHLLAELIENAAMFSPSGTRVEVRAERVANGFAVEVEDRGLGVHPDLLGELNGQLADPPDFALADPDRLGLFVVGKLAARHAIRISLKPSPYGGTTAIALIPHDIVPPAEQPGADALRDAMPAAGRAARLDGRPGGALVLTGRHAGQPAPAEAAGPPPARPGSFLNAPVPDVAERPGSLFSPRGWPGPDRPPDPGGPPGPGSLPAADTSAPGGSSAGGAPGSSSIPAAPAGPGSPAPGSGPAAATYRGLPRRVRQASLSQHLRGSTPPDAAPKPPGSPVAEPSAGRTPENARDFVASFRTGWQRDAESAPPDTPPQPDGGPGPEDGPPAALRSDSVPPSALRPDSVPPPREET
jgi:signal transduction histidine kinase